MRKFYQDNKRYIDRILFLAGFFLAAYIFFEHVLVFVSPFVAGLVLSAAISPLVGFIQRKLKIARGISTIFLIIIVILLVAIAATSIVNRIVIEAGNLAETLPANLEELRGIIYDVEGAFDRYMTFIPDEFTFDFSALVNQIFTIAAEAVTDAVRNASVGLVTGVPLLVMNVFLTFISAFFFTKDKKLIQDSLMKAMPEWLKSRTRTVHRGLLSAVGGYVKAQLIIMSVVASICILGLTILQGPYAVLMGLVLSLLDVMPMIGVSLAIWPWAIFSLTQGDYRFAIGLLIINGACFMARQLLEPKVLGQQIGIHPLLVLIGVYVGFRVFGVIGLFLGPVLLVIAKLILKTSAANKIPDYSSDYTSDNLDEGGKGAG